MNHVMRVEERLLWRARMVGEAESGIADTGVVHDGWREFYEAAMLLKHEVEKGMSELFEGMEDKARNG